jgi:hypothetical protein
MARERVFANLARSTQIRYERAGIGREQYESGVSLAKARGHAKTPEHPTDAVRNPERYRDYLGGRQTPEFKGGQLGGSDHQGLVRDVANRVHELFDPSDEAHNRIINRLNDPRVTDDILRKMLTTSKSQWEANARRDAIRGNKTKGKRPFFSPWFYK